MYTFFEEELPLLKNKDQAWNTIHKTSKLSDGIIFKPRTLFWEYLFFSKDSLFRSELNRLFSNENVISPLKLFPELEFYDPGLLHRWGRVSSLKLKKLDKTSLEKNPLIFEQIGSLLAFLSWFGIRINTPQDVALGITEDGNLALAPLDIKKIFIRFNSPFQVGLLASHFCARCLMSSGLFHLYSVISHRKLSLKAAEILYGYLECLSILKKYENTVNLFLLKNYPQVAEVPIYVTTSFEIFSTLSNQGYLHPEDILKNHIPPKTYALLKKMDHVPAFFRILSQPNVYFKDMEGTSVLCPDMFVNQNEYIHLLTGKFENRNFEELYHIGASQIARNFPIINNHTFTYKDVSLNYIQNEVFLKRYETPVFKVAR